MTGSIKTKTPKYKFIIPQFNIATWHDYIEDNFRAIDALFFNIFDVQNFSGSWTKTTEYKKDQVLFISEDYEVDETGQLKKDDQGELIVSEFSGRMVKVLKDHTTDNSDYFSLYYFNHKDEYELFADASTAQKFANLAKQYSENAQQSENNAELYKNNAQGYAQEAENSKNIAQQNAQLATNKAESATSSATIAKNSENSAVNSATLAEGYKNDAKSFADSAERAEKVAVINAQIVNEIVQEPNLVTVGTDLRSSSSNIKNVSSISEQTKNVSNNMSYIISVDNNKVNINKAVTNEDNITTVADNINNINITAQNKNNIDTVASYKDAITTTSTNINAVNNVSKNITNVKAVDSNKVNIDKVAADKDNIDTVATNILNVNTVVKNIDNVNLLAPHTEAMEALAPNIMDVVTVSGITEQTKNVSDNMAHVVAVDNNKANIDKAVANATNITTVATSINNVNAVAGNKTNIDNVAANKTDINNVASNITAVNNVSENMADVKKAVQSANDAKLWAVGTKTEKPEGSSKYWAEEAKNAVQVYDASETVKGIVRLATSDEVTAGTNNSAAITPLKLKQKIAQDLTNPSADTVPSTKAVKTAIDTKDSLPSQTGNDGKFLTTNGTTTSWAAVNVDTSDIYNKIDSKQDKSTAVNYNNISNCITYIPQDIKLELNNGTLTLKAGSKVYAPNGAGVFDEVVISNDVTVGIPYTNGPIFIYYSNNSLQQANYSAQCSGASNTIVVGYWYDTTNNFIKRINNSEVSYYGGISLPIAIVSASNGSWTTIDQVFNGFGYIGSTIFALPGVKGLIPNSRNADGSLKSIEFTLDKVLTYNCTMSSYFGIKFDGTEPILGIYGEQLYNSSSNTVIFKGVVYKWMYSGSLIYSNGRITSFTPKTVFHALDYNDKSTISGWSMPSNRYIDLTAAHGQNYIAPANGYFSLQGYMIGTTFGNTLGLYNQTKKMGMSVQTPESVNSRRDTFVPVSIGDTVTVYCYSATVTQFRFIYAEGEN